MKFPNEIRVLFMSVWFLSFMSRDLKVSGQSEPIDVEHYSIALDISNLRGRSIKGYCELELNSRAEHSNFRLFLQGLKVDSIVPSTLVASYTREGINLNISWRTPFSPTESSRKIRVYYGGQPEKDPSWGGFYFNGDYAFNMGVGFESEPHNLGRVWFPCMDNFTDRSTYDFYIETAPGNKAMCNGVLQAELKLPNGNTEFHWSMRTPIPTYLASVSVAPYTVRNYVHRDIPVTLAAVAKDSQNMANVFQRLPEAMDAFLQAYGPHRFDRVGFNVVPFSSGAMEHATNIAYPINVLNDIERAEPLFAHELAHHWWGNNTTCRGANEMWLNEGWASFSESLFAEYVYGREAYRDNLRATQAAVLHYAHLRDGDTLALDGVEQETTYGAHSYDKGAVVIACLRGYMGDSAFFRACRSFQQEFNMRDVSTNELRDHFQTFTTRDLTAFFRYWVSNPGQPHFDILEWSHKQNGDSVDVAIRIRQQLFLAPEYYTGVPLTIRIYDRAMQFADREVVIDQPDQWVNVRIPMEPAYMLLDPEEQIMDALTDVVNVIEQAGEYDFKEALMKLKTEDPPARALVHIAHHWVSPDRYFVHAEVPVLSRERYWTVGGIWPEGFRPEAEIVYNGRRSGVNYSIGYLDDDLIRITEDSLKLYYRPHPTAYWKEYPEYEKVIGSKLDRYGTIRILNLKQGEYTLAMSDQSLLGSEPPEERKKQELRIYPNPAEHFVVLECSKAKGGTLEITDLNGRVVFSKPIEQNNWKVELDTSMLPRGYYLAGIICSERAYESKGFFLR
ncbi:MAG: T9SS type A sorting domain-containing protein [Flavobacteriales bacterium]|nr:T9SS type A sorting domain-containing protein [Flavobacteriales bacterium]